MKVGSFPFLWPALVAAEAGRAASALAVRLARAASSQRPARAPDWTTPNKVVLELPSLRLRDFSIGTTSTPALICSPFALHGSTIADFAHRHSLIEALLGLGLDRLFLAEWRSATDEMRNQSIDHMLADLFVAVEEVGEPLNLIGICQGGWMALAFAARFPERIRRLVLAGAPVDTAAADSRSSVSARIMPFSTFEDLVALGGGRVLGEHVLDIWAPFELDTPIICDMLQLRGKISRSLEERFRNWHAWTVDLPGVYYLQVVEWLFKENRLAASKFEALGRRLDLSKVNFPIFMLAGARDELVAPEQLFATARYVGTPARDLVKHEIDSRHLGLFMGQRTLTETWPLVARWLKRPKAARSKARNAGSRQRSNVAARKAS